MRIRGVRVVAVGVIALVGVGGLSVARAAEPSDQPIFPSGPLALTKADALFTVSVPVSNPTTDTFTIAAGEPDTDQATSACSVEVPEASRTISPSSSAVLKLNITARDPGCIDPSKGPGNLIVLTATGSIAGATAIPIVLTLAAGSTPPAKVEATGITWPKDPVFLHRKDGKLEGEFTVVNPTQEAIEVTLPVVNDECEPVSPLAEDSEANVTTVDPGDTASIEFTVPACNEFDSSTMTVTVSAETDGGAKADVAALVLKAEVDWGRLGLWLGIIFVVAFALAFTAVAVALGKRNDGAPGSAWVDLVSPLIVEADAPKSWLTAVAAVGPVLGGLASATGVTEGLTGSDAIPQSTLIAVVSALALALVGVAGLIGNTPLARAKVGKEEQDCPVVLQFALSAAVMATSAGITIWAFATAVSRLDLALSPKGAYLIAAIASGVLALYLTISVHHYVVVYAGPLPETAAPPTASAELIAATTQALAPYYLGDAPDDPCDGPPTYVCAGPPETATFAKKVAQWIDGSLVAATDAATRAAETAKKKAEESAALKEKVATKSQEATKAADAATTAKAGAVTAAATAEKKALMANQKAEEAQRDPVEGQPQTSPEEVEEAARDAEAAADDAAAGAAAAAAAEAEAEAAMRAAAAVAAAEEEARVTAAMAASAASAATSSAGSLLSGGGYLRNLI